MPLRLGGIPTEGWAANQHARVASDLAALKRTLPLGRFRVEPSGPSVVFGWTRSGNAPMLMPTGGRNGAGDVTWTFPASYADEYEVAVPTSIYHAFATVYSSSGSWFTPGCEVVAPNKVRVRTWAAPGGALTDVQVFLTVWQ